MKNKDLLNLPSVSEIIQLAQKESYHNNRYIKFLIKQELHDYRMIARNGELKLDRSAIIEDILFKLSLLSDSSIKPVINATGIVLHTGLGRAPISKKIINKVVKRLSGYVNLELNLDNGKRGQRQNHISKLIASITGSSAPG